MILQRLIRAYVIPLLALLPSFHLVAVPTLPQDFIDRNQSRLEILFRSLDASHPAMGPIVEQWDSGRKAEASSELVTYFQNKAFPVELLETPLVPPNLMEQAQAALDDRFFILDAWQEIPKGPEGSLDWSYRGTREDKEIAWMLNRHSMLTMLAIAYQESNDVKFRSKLNQLLSGWITANPYPGGLTFSPAWRALEVARRILNSWTFLFYGEDVLDPQTVLLVLSSIPDHADSLHQHASFWGGNHLISEKLALLTLATAWPEFSDAETWEADAIDVLSNQFIRQTYPDGSYRELSNHYQRVVLVNAQLFMGLLATVDPGHGDRPVARRIARMWDFFARSMRPDGNGPLNNASDLEVNATFLREIYAKYNQPDWLYMATNGNHGTAPEEPASVLFPWAGQAFIRDSWNRDADWLYFDAGPYGTAHQHVDRMHLSAVISGEPVLVDGGRFTYKPGFWKSYFQGPDSHNILKLDGQPCQQYPREVRHPVPIEFNASAYCVFTGATSQFVGQNDEGLLPSMKAPVPWTRSILYDKRGFAIILDHVVAFSSHRLEAVWNFHPNVMQPEAQEYLRIVLGQDDLKVQLTDGFHSPDYNRKVPSLRMVFNGSIDQPTTLAWILQDPKDPPVRLELSSTPGDKVLRGSLLRNDQTIAELTIRLFPEPELIEYSIQ